MSKSLAELLAKPTGVVEEKKEIVDTDFSALKNSLSNSNDGVTIGVAAKPDVQVAAPISQPEVSSQMNLPELAGVDLADIPDKPSTPAFFSQTIIDQEFNSPEQEEAFKAEQIAQLKKALDMLVNSLDNKELVADAIRFVFTHVQNHPFLEEILQPEDLGVMVRGLRESYGVVIEKKNERKGKKAANAEMVDKIGDMLGDFMI